MLANPKKMIEKGYVRNLFDTNKQIQPNAIDWTVDAVSLLDPTDEITITENQKNFRSQSPTSADKDGLFILEPYQQYDVFSDMYVVVPEGKAAILVLRSTFVRNGLVLASGLYDSGFKGNIGAVLHTNGCKIRIGKGTRLGQIMFIDSESVGTYAGGYNNTDGVHWKNQ
jgi:deoxycytidine triphosphate deaminase